MSLIPDAVIRELEDFQRRREELTIEVVKQYDYIIEDMQTAQMEQGIDRDGEKIGPPYAQVTKVIKRQKGQPTDRVTLKDTGDFHRSVRVFPGAKAFQIGATDEKTPKLERKYGADIFGLTDDNLQEFIDDYLGPELKERFQKIIEKINR